MDDKQIISLFSERSEQAITALEDKYGPLLRRVSGNFLRDRQDVEECVNDALLAAWNSIPPAQPDPLSGFVCKLVRNLSLNRYHANTAQKRNGGCMLALDELAECLPDGRDPASDLEARELGRAIDRFLAGLKREDRILFVRRYWYAEPVTALAEERGCSVNRISVRLHRIREKLKAQLQKEGVLG